MSRSRAVLTLLPLLPLPSAVGVFAGLPLRSAQERCGFSDAQCKSWFLAGGCAPPGRRPRNMELRARIERAPDTPTLLDRAANSTLVVYATCARDAYDRAAQRRIARLLKANMPSPQLLVAVSCTGVSDENLIEADVLLVSECAAAHGYDAGLWQQGVFYARRVLGAVWRALSCMVLVNDSVLGPLYPFKCGPHLTAGAVWKNTFVSSAVTAYGREMLASAGFTDFWQRPFGCGKWGSMKLLENVIGARNAIGRFSCLTYSNDIMAWANASARPLTLPFYKHKSYPETTLAAEFRRQGERVFDLRVHTAHRSALVPCAPVRTNQPCAHVTGNVQSVR